MFFEFLYSRIFNACNSVCIFFGFFYTYSFFQCILLFSALAVSSNRFFYFYNCFLDCRSPDFQHLYSFDFEIIFPLMHS